MPNSVRERYMKMKNSPLPVPNIDAMIENFDRAVSHPDEQDLEQLRQVIASSQNKIEYPDLCGIQWKHIFDNSGLQVCKVWMVDKMRQRAIL